MAFFARRSGGSNDTSDDSNSNDTSDDSSSNDTIVFPITRLPSSPATSTRPPIRTQSASDVSLSPQSSPAEGLGTDDGMLDSRIDGAEVGSGSGSGADTSNDSRSTLSDNDARSVVLNVSAGGPLPAATYPNNIISGMSGDSCECSNLFARGCASCLQSVLKNDKAVSERNPRIVCTACTRIWLTCSRCSALGRQCVVTPLGLCMSAPRAESLRLYYNSTLVSSTGSTIPHSNEFFSALNFSYCSSDDDVCTRCSEQWHQAFHPNKAVLADVTNFSCVGRDGCICTAYCELRELREIRLDSAHNANRDLSCKEFTENAFESSAPDQSVFTNMLLLSGGLVIVVFVRSFSKQIQKSTFVICLVKEVCVLSEVFISPSLTHSFPCRLPQVVTSGEWRRVRRHDKHIETRSRRDEPDEC